jgi:hypothetical protein
MPGMSPRQMTQTTLRRVLAVALLAMVVGQGRAPALAQQAPSKSPSSKSQAPSADDALLQDLDNELLDGLGEVEKKPAAKRNPPAAKSTENKPPGQNQPGEPADRPLDRPLDQPVDGEDAGQPSAEQDPLGYISQQMRDVESLIPEPGKHAHAEDLQRRIVDDLARLIEQAQKQQQSQSKQQGSQQKQQSAQRQSVQQPKPAAQTTPGGNADQPAGDSADQLRQQATARPDPELFKGLLKDVWGQLPEREREQMLQTSREKFLPRYELLIERYYKRLAEQRDK